MLGHPPVSCTALHPYLRLSQRTWMEEGHWQVRKQTWARAASRGAQGGHWAKPRLLWSMLGMLQSDWGERKRRTTMESRSNMFLALKKAEFKLVLSPIENKLLQRLQFTPGQSRTQKMLGALKCYPRLSSFCRIFFHSGQMLCCPSCSRAPLEHTSPCGPPPSGLPRVLGTH